MSDIPDPIESLVTSLLKELGQDAGREGLERTPERVARALRYFTQGYGQNAAEILNGALFEVERACHMWYCTAVMKTSRCVDSVTTGACEP